MRRKPRARIAEIHRYPSLAPGSTLTLLDPRYAQNVSVPVRSWTCTEAQVSPHTRSVAAATPALRMDPNFQPMGGPGQMMPQQQMQQQAQRAAQGPTAQSQIQSMIYAALQQQTGNLTGWRAQVLPNERVGLIFNIIGNLRLLSQNGASSSNVPRMIEIGVRFEKEIFEKSQNKVRMTRSNEVEQKLQQLLERRTQNQAGMQQHIQAQAQAQAQAQQQQQMMMNQNNMQGQAPRAMPQQPGQQAFSHLQRQMQASPLPGQQPQQAPMGLQNQGPPQNMTQNQQQQFSIPQQQQQQQNPAGRPPNNQGPMSQQEAALVNELTSKFMNQASDDEKSGLRASLQARMDPVQLSRYQSQSLDPLLMYYRQQAIARLRLDRSQRMQHAQAQQQLALSQAQNGPAALPMQPQRSMNPSPLNGPPPQPPGGNPDFGSFMGNMENLAAQQQQQGKMAQEAGQMVVPASIPPRNGTPSKWNSPARAQQQQQMFNAQQLQQQQRMQHAQQQQQQSQARLSAQQKAQQSMGLRGQPGGMGPGPNPPQQSPGMATLNAPLRTPLQQMNHPEAPQANPNAQFGQPLDPRFLQGNQRPGPANGMTFAGLNPAMLQGLGPDVQRTIAGMAPEKLNEVVNKWQESRAGQMNGANVPSGRPQMPMQGAGQIRPGQQMPPGGQFNPPHSTNQFMMGNPGQGPAQAMAASLNPQQQMVLQQQMATLRQNQMQQRVPPSASQMEQRTMQQMDNVDIPIIFQNHASMPQGRPAEIKKWGPLKQWIQQNPNLPPNSLDAVKMLQKMHYAQAMRSRAQQQGQAAGLQAGALQGQQSGFPTAAPMAAPVAPMGQNSMQATNGVNIAGLSQSRQPTAQEFMAMRNHPSKKLLNATDDQLRSLWMRTQSQNIQQAQGQIPGQLTPQQQQHRQQMMALQLSRMQQASGQPPQPNQMGLPQPNLGQPPQPTQPLAGPNAGPQSNPEPGAASNNRPRSQANGRNTAQSPSAAHPAKNLKRASSDDLVEIPNPNTQASRPAPHDPVQVPQNRANLTAQQIAAMDPETRKKFEAVRAAQIAPAQANQIPKGQPSDQARWKAILKEEQEKSREPPSDIPMDETTKKQTAMLLLTILPVMINISKALVRWLMTTQDEAQVRRFYQAVSCYPPLVPCVTDPPNPALKETFSISLSEAEQTRAMLGAMVKALSEKFPNMRKAEGAVKMQQSSSQQEPQTSTPLNAANLQQQQQQLNKLHHRKNSRSSHAPAAPTSSQNPLQFGAPSPHGTPAYAGKTTLKQEDLHIPARKKQKQNSTPGQGTPGSTSSPQVAKAVSPEVKRQTQPSLCCSEPQCDRHDIGFESQEALMAHTQEDHVKPLSDPLKFVRENLAATLGLDSQGKPKPATSNTTPDTDSTQAGAKMLASESKQGQAPTIKCETTPAGPTPMNRQVSMHRQGSAAGAKVNMQSKAAPAKEVPAKLQSGQKDQNRPKEPQAPQEAAALDPWTNSTIDPQDLFQSFQQFESGSGGAISDMNVYRSITPNDTPESSKDGVSEPNSDVSEGVGLDISLDIFDDSWQPFGTSDLDGLFDPSGLANSQDDLSMFDCDLPPAVHYQSWDDMVDPSLLDKPFSFNTSCYSMTAN
ncbi:hypothetical protein JHW43_004733 [Diplocarpon mali]|nr:hypothetical protein JHW43_004733 [Diplocarpon mali]